jgi:DNA-binding NarL/FixJ family response regulator
MNLKVMIVDDHLVVRQGLKQLLEIEDWIEVIAESASALECLSALEEICPDLIFMDIMMPGINGIEAARQISKKYPHIKIIMLTICADEQFVTDAIKAGAKGYVLKNVNRDELMKAIDHVMKDRAFLDPAVASMVFDHLKQDVQVPKIAIEEEFTRRELEVLQLMTTGGTNKKIGKILFISEHTVRSHMKNIYKKLRVKSKSEAVALAITKGLITK